MPFKILVQRATIAVELERKIVETLNAIIERSGARLALGCCQYVFGHSILAGCPRFAVIETQPRSVVKCSLTKKRRAILSCRRSIPKQSVVRRINSPKSCAYRARTPGSRRSAIDDSILAKKENESMWKKFLTGLSLMIAIAVLAGLALRYGSQNVQAFKAATPESATNETYSEPVATENGFAVEVLVDGRPLAEYAARGRRYIEALENAEYEVRIHNPFGTRVAVALSVDGLNSIDARHTSAWDAHKWVIAPYGTISVGGWQMSGDSARRFYFTTERDSYAAKLGQASNLGLITAVVFRERQPITITRVTPPYK